MHKKISYPFLVSCFTAIAFSLTISSCKTTKEGATSTRTLSDKDHVNFERLFIDGKKEEKVWANYELAETDFQQALKIDPSSGAAMYELANIYVFQNNKQQALLYSKKAAATDPKNIWYQLLYADCLKDNKQYSDVSSLYEKVIKEYPEKIDLYYELANAYLYQNKMNDALKVYNKIEERIGVTEDASMQKLKIYKTQNNFDKSVEEAKKLIVAFPKEAKYYGMLGEIYQDKGMPEKALAAYNDLLVVDPNNAYVHLSLADYYRNQKLDQKAFDEIKLAFKSKDLDIDTKIKILLSYYDITEKFPELKPDADELCKIIVAVHPDEAKAFSMYGDFLYRDNKLEEARAQYRKAIDLDKEKYALWNQLLLIESTIGDIAAMEKESKDAIEYFPNQPLPYFFNGAANIQLKKYSAAIASLSDGKEFVYDNQPLLAQFYAYLGDAQNAINNHSASDSAYDKSLELDPINVNVLNNYAYYLSLRNINLEKAEAMSKKSNDLQPNNNSYQDTYGWILFQMKKYDDAKTWVGKALENGGKNSGTLLEHYGDILFRLGQTNEALQYWIDAKKAGGATDMIDKKIADKKLDE